MANEQNALRVWNYLTREIGLDDVRAAAIMGNFSQESGFDTGAISSDGEGSLGIGQWTYGRRSALESIGGDPTSLDTQLLHFRNEISEGGARRYAWENLLSNDGDLASLTNGWCDDFESPLEEYADRPNRIAEAERYLSMFGGGNYTGSIMGMLAPLHAQSSGYAMYGDLNPATTDYSGEEDHIEEIGTMRAYAENFWDSLTTGGVARFLEYVWGGIAHSGKMYFEKKDPVTQEDIDYVSQALPEDKDTQQFILLNGRDSQEIRWLVNQKLVEKNRQARIAKWKEENDSILARFAVGVGGAAGYLFDPLNLVPLGSAVKSSYLMGRLGSALMNPMKAKEIAVTTLKTGLAIAERNAPLVGSVLTNDYIKERMGAGKQNYIMDAAVAMLAGTVLSVAGYGIGRAFSRYSTRPTLSDEAAAAADRAETNAYLHAADADRIRSETIGEMRKLHDTSFGQTLKSDLYNGFEKNGRIIATTYEKARTSLARAGIDLPKDAKAFYVPNEDYAVLLTDNIKGKAQVESLLAHEFAVHAGLFQSIGKKEYVSLMNQVKQAMNKKGTVFNALRRKYDTQDPEEVFAHAIEDDVLPQGIASKLKGIFNQAFRQRGYGAKFTREDITDILRKQADMQRRGEDGFYYNPDGSTAFAGVRYSRDNLLNPRLWEDLYQLDSSITKDTQGDLPAFLRWIGKKAESGNVGGTPFGVMANSMSNTAREYAPKLFADARGRGMGNVRTLSAEEQKEWIVKRLNLHFGDFLDARSAWIGRNKKLPFRSAQLAFNHMVSMHYNAKYAGHKGVVIADVPPEVEKAADALHRLREEQIEIGQHSADYFGASGGSLIEKDWYPVDHELWRIVDTEARARFLARYNSIEDAYADLAEYYRTFADREIVRSKLERKTEMKNIMIERENADRKAKGLELLKKKEVNITEDDITYWIDSHIPGAVDHALRLNLDPADGMNLKELGNLSFLQARIPMDTTRVMKFNAGTPNEFDFSFDTHLRSFDLDTTVQKNTQRFAGEIAAKNVFGTEQGMQKALASIKNELEMSIAHGDANTGVMKDYARIEEAIRELRGVRPREDSMSQMGAVARILLNTSYAKNGANMGFSQLGEIGGAIAYGGTGRIVGAVPMLRDLMLNIREGKVSADAFREAERYMFGRAMEAEVWSTNARDQVVRDALTQEGSVINKGIFAVSDFVKGLGRVTSTLNLLPKMTESMYCDMRTNYLVDAVNWAAGKEFSKVRNPFSAAKLKASNVTEEMAERIKTNLREAVKQDGEGRIISIDTEGWKTKDPESYFKFYGMGETHAQRAIVSGMRQGNKNFLKNANWFTRMLFQFKDYNLRAINAQTMRALTARELDDAIAFGMSIATNTAAYALRVGAKVAGMYALGNITGANDYMKRMFDDGQLLRVAALRSAFTSPLSFGNDAYEAWTGAPTIRTTVDRPYGRRKDADTLDNIADAVKQLPAIQTGASLKAVAALPDIISGDATQKDLKAFYKALPIPNFIPFMTYIDHVIGGSGLPKK